MCRYPEIGVGPKMALFGVDCGQNNLCGTSTENDDCVNPGSDLNCGFCCDNSGATANLPCDHTDGVNECAHATFCTDGTAEELLATVYQPGDGYYAAYLATVFAPPLVSIFTVPIGNASDGPDAGDQPDFVNGAFVRNGNELVLRDANSDTWAFLEYRIGDWDPVEGTFDDNHCPPDPGTPDPNDVLRCERIRAYHVALDVASFTTGSAGTLTPKLVACNVGDATPCTAAFGLGSNCDYPAGCTDPNCACEFIFMNFLRGRIEDPDPIPHIFAVPMSNLPLGAADLIGFRFGANVRGPSPVTDPDPYPATGLYLGNMILDVPSDARGTFTIGMDPANTNVTRETSDFIPLLGLRPGYITIEVGKCCRGIGSPTITCEDGLLAKECTGPGSRFQAGQVCSGNVDCDCNMLEVAAAGGRYLEVTPQPTDPTVPMALVVRPGCPGAAPRYVGAPSGPWNVAMLVDDPGDAALLTPAQWGTVYVAGDTVVPGTAYEVQVDCRGPAGSVVSAAVTVETPIWGDAVGMFVEGGWQGPDGEVDITDATAILNAFRHYTAAAPTIYQADIWGCVPDQDPAIIDVTGSLNGFRHISFTRSTGCPVPCP